MNQQLPRQQHNFPQEYCSASRGVQIGSGYRIVMVICLLAACAGTKNSSTIQSTPTTNRIIRPTPTLGSIIHHYEYVFPDGGMYVYDMDNGHKLVKMISLATAGVRGVVASPVTH